MSTRHFQRLISFVLESCYHTFSLKQAYLSPMRITNVPYGVNWTFLAAFRAHAILYEVFSQYSWSRKIAKVHFILYCMYVCAFNSFTAFFLIYDPAYINSHNRQYFFLLLPSDHDSFFFFSFIMHGSRMKS